MRYHRAKSPFRFGSKLLAAGSFLLLASCSIEPKLLTSEELQSNADRLHHAAFASVPAGNVKLGFHDVLSRAVLANLDIRQGQLAAELAELSLQELILRTSPNADTRLRNSNRNNDGGDINDITPPDRRRKARSLSVNWSVLGLGQAYIRAKQQANANLILEEERRRTANEIVAETAELYMRAAIADRQLGNIQAVLNRIQDSTATADQYGQEDLIDPLDALLFKTRIIELKSALHGWQSELLADRARLAALVLVDPNQLKFSESVSTYLPGNVSCQKTEKLERLALLNRPEVRQGIYGNRNGRLDAYRAMARLLPDFSLAANLEYDSESSLNNNTYIELTETLTYNLINILQVPNIRRQNATREALREVEELTVAVAVIEQVRIAQVQASLSRSNVNLERERRSLWIEISDIQEQRTVFDIRDELNQFEYQVRAINAQITYEETQAQYYSDVLRLMRSIGVDLFPKDLIHLQQKDVSQLMAAHWSNLMPNLNCT
ncbi:Outer membrane efflux protein [Falsiruegeria litorea R37]|uniref:Outer membrane efflux protein n=1 Tax=Falsiruegeria litorea R37 TaxID=1200284 RepID=A0A1Y5TXU9_9RHOB|nr:TolC family protein [Falsiruegeria litorea]SLN73391.1 Outer membrane efflux protein [Falsiruegeria litorea R37]